MFLLRIEGKEKGNRVLNTYTIENETCFASQRARFFVFYFVL